VSLRVLDLQGRLIRGFSLTASAPEVLWNGTDAGGSPLPYGVYFLRADGAGLSLNRRLPLLP
jgi:hypothetical protein